MFEFMQVDEVKFQLSKSVDWTLDGEKGDGGSEIIIKNLKQAITLIK